MLPFVEKTIVIVEDIVEKVIDLVFHVLSIPGDSGQVKRSLPTQRNSMSPVAYWDVEVRDQDRLFAIRGHGEVVMVRGTFLASSFCRCTCLRCFFDNSNRFGSVSDN